MLESLIDRQDRHVPRATQSSVAIEGLEGFQDLGISIAVLEAPVDEIGPGKMQEIPAHDGFMGKKRISGISEEFDHIV